MCVRVSVCVCVCMHVFVCECMRACMRMHVCVYVCSLLEDHGLSQKHSKLKTCFKDSERCGPGWKVL